MSVIPHPDETALPRAPLDQLALDVAGALHEDALLRRVVEGLTQDFGAALARVWVVRPGADCARCAEAAACEDHGSCLHLAASAGLSERLDGEYGRVPLGQKKIGEIAARREAHWTNAVLQDPRVAHKDWARDNDLKCFAGHPLVVDGRLLGVLATFGRQRLPVDNFRRLGFLADLLAIALRNARTLAGSADARASAEGHGRSRDVREA